MGEGVRPSVCVRACVHMRRCVRYVCILARLLAFLPLLKHVCVLCKCVNVRTSESVCQRNNEVFNYSLRYIMYRLLTHQ